MTAIEIRNTLDRAVSNRKLELVTARSLLECHADELKDKEYLSRSLIIFLYAHCEGFLKDIFKISLEFLCKDELQKIWLMYKGHKVMKPSYKADNSPNIIPRDIKKLIKDIGEVSFQFKPAHINFICTWVLKIDSTNGYINVHKKFCTILGEHRHGVAHGKDVVIDHDFVIKRYEDTLAFFNYMLSASPTLADSNTSNKIY